MKLSHTSQSEGYETMTQGSSDIASEVRKILHLANFNLLGVYPETRMVGFSIL